MSKYTIDRFEGEFAVLLDRQNEEKQILVLKDQLPAGAKEGDILQLAWNEEGTQIADADILKEETDSAKQRAEDLLQKLLNKNK